MGRSDIISSKKALKRSHSYMAYKKVYLIKWSRTMVSRGYKKKGEVW
jgi:hypothetical protein